MEVTKWLKPSISVRIDDSASVQAATRVIAEQVSKGSMCRPTRVGERLIRLNNGMVRPCSSPTSKRSWQGRQRQGAHHLSDPQSGRCEIVLHADLT